MIYPSSVKASKLPLGYKGLDVISLFAINSTSYQGLGRIFPDNLLHRPFPKYTFKFDFSLSATLFSGYSILGSKSLFIDDESYLGRSSSVFRDILLLYSELPGTTISAF